jgi:hypothetical protein
MNFKYLLHLTFNPILLLRNLIQNMNQLHKLINATLSSKIHD